MNIKTTIVILFISTIVISNGCIIPPCTMQQHHINTLGVRNSILDTVQVQYGQQMNYHGIQQQRPPPTPPPALWTDRILNEKKNNDPQNRGRSIPRP